MNGRLDGKIALITGAGGSQIGRVTSRRFAAEGATVVCADRPKDQGAGQELVAELRENGLSGQARTVDLTDHLAVRAVLEQTIDEHGRLDVLFNLMVWGRVPSDAGWEFMLASTFAPAYFGTRYGCQLMARHGGGSVINTSSIAGVALSPQIRPLPPVGDEVEPVTLGTGSYAAAKATIAQLTREYAVMYGRRGVRVNALAPGIIATPWTLSTPLGEDEARRRLEERAIPLGRLGLPEEIAGPAVFLASDDSSYMTGHLLVVDGGFSHQPA
jgi:NAD(P)-dependent dehydrogenase (short-subunit alcohol dehydrogenase family)